MNRTLLIFTLALVTGAVSAFPQFANAALQRPSADAPPGWTTRDGGAGSEFFLPPGATTLDVYEAIFPGRKLNGSLEDMAAAFWRRTIAGERLVDSKSKRITVSDGVPAYEVLVATVNAQNQGVYRVFVFKQYGRTLAAGELRFNSVDVIKAIGQPAVASLENMSAGSTLTP